MSILNNEHILIDASLEGCFDKFLEEWDEFTKFSDLSELMLEVDPDIMGIHVGRLVLLKQNNIIDLLVKPLLEFSKLRALKIPWCHILVFWEHLEKFVSVVEVHSVVVGQFEI